MAQATCEKPQAAVETAVNGKSEHRAPASATLNGATKTSDDLSAETGDKVNGVNVASATGEKKNRIQVSNTKKPLFFYLNLAKRYLKLYNEVELSGLGMAIPAVVTIAEILKANGVAVEKKVQTTTVDAKDENKGCLVQKAKLEIVLERKSASKGSENIQSEEKLGAMIQAVAIGQVYNSS